MSFAGGPGSPDPERITIEWATLENLIINVTTWASRRFPAPPGLTQISVFNQACFASSGDGCRINRNR